MTKPRQYSGIDFKPISGKSSLRTELFVSLLFVATGSAALAVILTSLAHRAVLEPILSTEDLQLVQRFMIYVLIIVSFAVISASAAGAWILARHFSLPISKLVEGMQRIFHNDLNVKLEVERTDELGSLVKFFNSMVKKLQEVNERNEAISQLKSQFVSVAAHQLRTPLTGLKWSLQWLIEEKGGKLTKKQKETINQQYAATTRMISMVNELLDVALAEEGKFGYALQSVELDTILHEIIESFAPAAEARNITITLDKHMQEGLAVIGDPVQVKLAFSNLVDNAIRYTKTNGHITIRITQQKGQLAVTISDSGIGIPEEEVNKLFTKFYRASNAQRLQPDGSGLGLYMVKNIITGHGGTISVQSKEGEGTTFNIKLPLQKELVPPETLSEGIATL